MSIPFIEHIALGIPRGPGLFYPVTYLIVR